MSHTFLKLSGKWSWWNLDILLTWYILDRSSVGSWYRWSYSHTAPSWCQPDRIRTKTNSTLRSRLNFKDHKLEDWMMIIIKISWWQLSVTLAVTSRVILPQKLAVSEVGIMIMACNLLPQAPFLYSSSFFHDHTMTLVSLS